MRELLVARELCRYLKFAIVETMPKNRTLGAHGLWHAYVAYICGRSNWSQLVLDIDFELHGELNLQLQAVALGGKAADLSSIH